MSYLRPSVFDFYTDDSSRNFQSVHKTRVHHETNERFQDNLLPNFLE